MLAEDEDSHPTLPPKYKSCRVLKSRYRDTKASDGQLSPNFTFLSGQPSQGVSLAYLLLLAAHPLGQILYLANEQYLSINATIALLIGLLGIDWNLTAHHLEVLMNLAFGAAVPVLSIFS